MIITCLNQKYNCGCGRGYSSITEDDLLTKLNTVIEWDFCDWPKILKPEAESKGVKDLTDEDFTACDKIYGDQPELKPGDCFVYDGNVIAVDSKDTLVLVVTETGAGAIKRIFEEVINFEFKLLFVYSSPINSIKVSKDKLDSIDSSFESYRVCYSYMEALRNKYPCLKEMTGSKNVLKVELDSESCLIPLTFYISDWAIYYNQTFIVQEQLEDLSKEIIAGIFLNYPRNTEFK